MTRTNIALVLLVISAHCIQLFLVSNRGHIASDSLITENVFFWLIAAASFITGVVLLLGKSGKMKRLL
jgi:hypothetical protein